jgi:hypothetical protein
MKKIYIYDKQTGGMVEKRPENELSLPEIPIPETSFEKWKALILAECGQEELDAKIHRGEPYEPPIE